MHSTDVSSSDIRLMTCHTDIDLDEFVHGCILVRRQGIIEDRNVIGLWYRHCA